MKLASIVAVTAIMATVLCQSGDAAKAQAADNPSRDTVGLRIVEIDGPYTYDADGVPILGWIVERLTATKVKFRMCSERTAEIDLSLLKKTEGHCARDRRGPIPWFALDGKIVPSMTATPSSVKSLAEQHVESRLRSAEISALHRGFIDENKVEEFAQRLAIRIDLLPAPYRHRLVSAPSSTTVAVSFKDENGWTLGILKSVSSTPFDLQPAR